MDTRPTDRMFNCLPLYHSVGGVVATGATLVSGGAVVIRARFSASDFGATCAMKRCTLFQYIGELCRYLVNAPHQEIEKPPTGSASPAERPEAGSLETFQNRFKIPRIRRRLRHGSPLSTSNRSTPTAGDARENDGILPIAPGRPRVFERENCLRWKRNTLGFSGF